MIFNRVLIADDEPAARRKIRAMLGKLVDQEKLVIGEVLEASNGLEAEEMIVSWQPELVLLDINMPYKNGLQVAQATQAQLYHLIFVTAYDEHAIKAFETHALDYLLKPVGLTRLVKALEKITLLQNQFSPVILNSLQSIISQSECQISIKRGNATVIIEANEVGYMEALTGYCRIHLTKEGETLHKLDTLLSDTPLGQMREQLPEDQFMRIHRSYVVNCQQVERYFTKNRRVFVCLKDYDQIIPVSRSKVGLVRERWPAH